MYIPAHYTLCYTCPCACIYMYMYVRNDILQPPGSELLQHTQSLSVQNVSPLPFTAVLMCIYPFSFKNVRGKLQQLVCTLAVFLHACVFVLATLYMVCMFHTIIIFLQELELSSSQREEVVVQFDSTYCKDRHSRLEENHLVVAYKQHPLRVRQLMVLYRSVHAYFITLAHRNILA